MAAKKKRAPRRAADPEGFVAGYDLRWMQQIGEEHPDYKKVMKEARKKKYIK